MAGPGYQPATGRYSVGDAFSYGWRKFSGNLGPWLLAMLGVIVIAVILVAIFAALAAPFTTTQTVHDASGTVVRETTTVRGFGAGVIGLLGVIVYALFGWVVEAQFIRAALETTKRGTAALTVFVRGDLLSRFVVAALLLALISFGLGVIGLIPIIGGLIQFVGGLLLAFFAQFFAYFVLDHGAEPWESIKSSVRFVNANLASILVLSLLSMVSIILGFILCGVGLFVAIPVVVLAHAYTYRVLNGQPVAA